MGLFFSPERLLGRVSVGSLKQSHLVAAILAACELSSK